MTVNRGVSWELEKVVVDEGDSGVTKFASKFVYNTAQVQLVPQSPMSVQLELNFVALPICERTPAPGLDKCSVGWCWGATKERDG